MRRIDQEEIDISRNLCDRGLRYFIREAWDIAEPAKKFIENWHIDAICDHLQACATGDLTRLVINVPPGATKSMSCCVFFPAWLWTQDAKRKFIFSSYAEMISFRDSRRTRRLITSDWYQHRFGDRFKIDEENAAKLSTFDGGFRLATTVGGSVTGEHADIQLVDDPLKPLEVTGSMNVSRNALEKVLMWWNETMSSRLTSFDKGVRIIIMQRLHENDLAGACLKDNGYEHLMLPMEFERKRKCFTSIGFEDPRTEEGDLLFKQRFPEAAVATIKKDLGPRGAQAQLQQNPTPAEGNIIKQSYVRYCKHMPVKFDHLIQSWDCTFKDAENSDFVVGQVWGAVDAKYYLLDQVRKRMGFVDTVEAVKRLTIKHPKAFQKLVEDKANGSAVVDYLRREISGFKLIEPEGGKEARCNAVEPVWAAGDVFLPHPDNCSWVEELVEEVVGFPARTNDDQVDAMTQALVWLMKKNLSRLRRAMKNAKRG